MRLPLSILRRLCPVDLDEATLARELNARVSEVEAIHRFPSRAAFQGVRVVELIAPLAAANEHTRWQTTEGAIVVADRYGVRAGERYAAVLDGGKLPDGTAVTARTVAGHASEGMLVSEVHLGIGKDAARPLRLAPDTPAGADAFDALELDDVVFEFDLEPNRPDLYSLLGIARDASAIWSLPLRAPTKEDLSALPKLDHAIRLETPRARRYEALHLRGVRVGPSPQWLQNAVRKLGMRPINNVVDAGNLAMMEFGQPLHTFDRSRLRADAIVLRMAANGEEMTTLDGVRRTLTDECLLVCDGAVPVALAGVMGDAESEVGEGTTDVLVECAAFDMAAVRRASRRLSLRTEASLRFEKGLPIAGVRPAMERLALLLAEVAGAEPVALGTAGEEAPERVGIPLDRERIRRRLAMDVSDAEIDRILAALGFYGAEITRVPESRPDVRIADDLVEEVGRIHGYEHVRGAAPVMPLSAPTANPVVVAATRARRVLTAHGWDEVYLPAWIGDAEVDRYGLDRGELIALVNPIAENLKYFRTTALPALAAAAVANRKELQTFSCFEAGKIYRRVAGAVDERPHLAGIAIGRSLLDVREALIAVGRALGMADLTLSRPAHPHLHPGRSFALGGWAVGGELHPRLVRALELREAPVHFAASLELHRAALTRFVPPPRFPSIELDLNVTVPPRVEAAAVLEAVPKLPLLRSAVVSDVYPLLTGARLTVSLSFNSPERSLTQEEAAAGAEAVRTAMAERGWS